MRIAVIGAGAMGSIYGGHLSKHHEVYLIDTHVTLIEHINQHGLCIKKGEHSDIFYPKGITSTKGKEPVDLVILFVKALYSRDALRANQSIIGNHTYVLTLQNGSGHEHILSEFIPMERIVIGTTQDHGAVQSPGMIIHGGDGTTNIGMIRATDTHILPEIKKAFDLCGFQTILQDSILQLIWDKLFINVSLSVVTGVLQVPMGFIAENEYAWNLVKQLLKEAVMVAKALGLQANEDEIQDKIYFISKNNPEGMTSIYTDLKHGRKTEVDTISGSVVSTAKKLGLSVPTHEAMVNLVHSMESSL